MRYFGGKAKIAKPLAEFLQGQLKEGQAFVDMFCGSCNVVSKIKADVRIANDLNKYLVSMWHSLQHGWLPPMYVSPQLYKEVRYSEDSSIEGMALKSFIGFGCSFAGKWFGGYAKNEVGTDYCKQAFNSCKKKSESMLDVMFTSMSYEEFMPPSGSLIYCDIPYKGTTQYAAVGSFNHGKFYSWASDMAENGFDILVSEYEHNVPDGWEVVWLKESKQSIRNKDGGKTQTVEVLMKPIVKEPRNNNEAA